MPTTLGLVLWQAARHVRDWAAQPEARPALFHPPPRPAWVAAKRAEARALAPGLPLDRILDVTAAPLGVEPRALAEACRQVALWGEEHGHREVAIHFAEAGALAAPWDARLANLAGRLTRNAGDYHRAELWLERGIGLARERHDYVEHARGHLGMALLCKLLRRDKRARKHFHAAAVTAQKSGREWLAAEAEHDLLAMMIERGYLASGYIHARRALKWYPKHHPRFPLFAADFACLLIRDGKYADASAVLSAAREAVQDPAQRIVIQALHLRAVVGVGDPLSLTVAREVEQVIEEQAIESAALEAAARFHLAEAERGLQRWKEAEENARVALGIATKRRDTEFQRVLAELLEEVQARYVPVPPGELPRPGVAELVEAIGERLVRWSPTRRGRGRSIPDGEWAA
ncbi:MAG TPA: hypothetical protein VFQ45_23385 [Longimicrobium sp.]|nr:hypothetical protein [Longimicrobium sp.]